MVDVNTPLSERQRQLARFVRPAQEFIQTESASALLLMAAALAALFWANSPWRGEYEELLGTVLGVDLGFWDVEGTVHFWVNDVAMVLFFFVIGLEVKREITVGELSDPRVMVTPIAGAIGGMLLPLGLFLLVAQGGDERSGWAIPMSTDIAFALGVAALLGSRVSLGLRATLLTFAIVDDIGTVAVIALFYSNDVQVDQIVLAAAIVSLMFLLYRVGIHSMIIFAGLGIGAWAATLESGVHPTTLGAILGFLTPWRPAAPLQGFVGTAEELLERFRAGGGSPDSALGHDQIVDSLLSLGDLTDDALPHIDRLEHRLHPWVAFLVVPAFALANAGVHLTPEAIGDAVSSTVTWGVVIGLVVGKPVGLLAAMWLAIRFGASWPAGVNWRGAIAISLVAGIGFTVALFVGDLAYSDETLLRESKVGIMAAFLIAAPAGFLGFRLLPEGAIPRSRRRSGDAEAGD